MCNFLSAVVLKNGDILTHPMIDSHAELVEYFKLPDKSAHIRHFVKVELTPTTEESWLDPSLWTFRLDEENKPAWWGDEMAAKSEADLRRRATAMIINDDKTPLVLDGCWIVGTKGKIREVQSGRVMRVRGGTISAVRGGTISAVWGGTISEVWGGTISAVWGGTISAVRGGTISAVWGGTISEVRGGTISAVWGGTISAVWGDTIVGPIGPYAKVDDSAKRFIADKPQK